MSLLNYWPIADEINKCIKHEAEGANDAVLLAVHRPSPLSYRLYSSTEKIPTNEEELFDYLMSEDVAEGVHIVPITGASGAGKSHMVRILNARLQSLNGDSKFVVIRIPKSASLRSVIELILEQLEGDEYAQVKADFASALTEDLDIESMVTKFQAELDIALQHLSTELKAKFQADRANTILWAQAGHADQLRYFFGDPVLVDHFRTNVFKRFVQRAIAGQHEIERESFVEDFVPNDLLLPEDIKIAQAADRTRHYYITQLLADGNRHDVTRLLNEKKIGDRAIRQLFKLHQSLGGMTLHEVILKIREQLLVQDKELVIFVEDFKALIGIQDTLLKILIQEGERENVQQYATLRSVIAVTDAYLATEDTFGTRAKREWRVESELSTDNEVLDRTKALVAAYLNAARWGFKELVRHFETKGNTGDGQGTWIQPYFDQEDDDDTVLKAFGSVDGIPLFPFTERAIEQLARTALIRNDKLLFTPRFIIDHILRDLLLKGRPAFEQGQFPPTSINMPNTNMEIAKWLNQYNGATKERYQRVVGIWGNAPQTVAEVGYIPKEVFDAFKLDRPNIEFIIIENPTDVDETQPAPPPPPTRTDDASLIEALEKWVQGQLMSQMVAGQIRKSVAAALNDRIDWNTERCAKISKIQLTSISIPNALGQGTIDKTPIQVADDHTDPSGQIRSELAAVTRLYELNNGKIAYAEADDDMVWVGSLADRLMPQALSIIRAEMQQKLSGALRLLQTNSQILGLVARGNTPASLAPFLFESVENLPNLPPDCNQAFADWYALKDSALRVRPELIQKVVSFCGSFQGDSTKTPYAIDMIRLTNLRQSENESINPRELGFTPELVILLQNQLREKTAEMKAKNALNAANAIRTTLEAEWGESFNKQVIVDEFEALADQLGECGAWNEQQIGIGKQAFKNRCKDFGKVAVHEALDTLSSAVNDGDVQLLSRMGRLNVNPLIVANNFLEKARLVIRVASRHASMLETQFNNVNPAAEAAEIQDVLQNLSCELDSYAVKGEAS
ncbi:protein DpdH [Methylomonas sp. BW4-1]|uniref:protein DpdH n=1 Tax=Methylomonas sp. BW4-1 TaxID=3376685 RepID=UPI004040F5A5